MSDLGRKALQLRQSGDNKGAIDLFRRHLAQNPNDLYAKHNLAAALGDVGRFSEAESVISGAIAAGLDKTQSWLVYARALAGTNAMEKAQNAYQTVLSADPSDVDAHRELAQLIWMSTGEYALSLKPLNDVIDRFPQAVSLHVLRAELAGQMGQTEDYFHWMNARFEASNRDGTMHFFLSKASLASGRIVKALEHGEFAIRAFPGDLTCTIHFVNCLLANGLPGKAVGLIERAREKDPIDQHLLALLATCWRMLGDNRYQELYDYDRLVCQLPLGVPEEWSNLDDYVNALESELDEEHSFVEHPFFLSVRHGSQVASITSSDRPAMKRFSEAVIEPISAYLSRLASGDDPLRSRNTGKADLFSAWSVKLLTSGYHVNHVHQEGWLSSACHLRHAVTDGSETKAGWLKFGEPGPVCKPDQPPEYYLKPERGSIAIFPSYMWHGTIPFAGNTDRLTVAADFVPG